ncbi:alpha/beta hydrolase [Dokdonia sp.]|uniref:alpha/beta fold hydrolase n=1 Tax=Dokdonia sp. TaxID=2024995 RepID=UPI003266EC25
MISSQLTTWEATGEYIPYGPFQHTLFVKQIGDSQATSDKTILLIHGFPESSYSYHAIVDGLLQQFDRIILFDLLGYGLSDKPVTGYTYSLFEQTDTVFAVWKHFGIKGGHLLAHDMGDSIATEIVARYENGLLPTWFSDGLQSITFTNGGMVLELASLRVTQKILLSRFGSLLSNLSTFKLFKQQIRSAHGNQNLSVEEIQTLWELHIKQDGHKNVHRTITYLNDRKRFEKTRWLPALQHTKIPIHICWGNEDAVAKVAIAHYLKENICKDATLTIMDGLGHFCQLGSPKKWIEHILSFYKK